MRAGIAASSEQVALAVVHRSADGKPHLVHCAVAPAAMGYADGALRTLLRDFELGTAPVSAVTSGSVLASRGHCRPGAVVRRVVRGER